MSQKIWEDTALCFLSPSVAPMVVQHPQSQFDLRPGDTAVFTVEATGTALTYSWSHNAAGLQDGGRIAGANTPTLTISDVQESDAGTYHCLISNPVGSIQSNSAMLSLSECIIKQFPL